MFNYLNAFSGFSVNDLQAAKQFYSQTLGLEVNQDKMGLTIKLSSGANIYVYQKDDHQPATYTILNFVVENIDTAIDNLLSNGVVFEHYNNMPAPQDEKGILRGLKANMGPDIAWFKDPAGNIFAVLQNN